jgi:hypothetical protein
MIETARPAMTSSTWSLLKPAEVNVVTTRSSTWAALLDERTGEHGQGGDPGVLRDALLADRLDVLRGDPFLQRQRRVERHRPGAGVCDGAGEQEHLLLRTAERATVEIPEGADEAAQEDWRLGHGCSQVGNDPKGLLQTQHGGPGLLGGRFHCVNLVPIHLFSPILTEPRDTVPRGSE